MDSAWFHDYVNRCLQRRSLPSPQAWVEAHDGLPPAPARGVAKLVGARVTHSARNDARTIAGVSGRGIDISFPPGSSSINDYNIFADLSLHDQAAATLDGVAVERFKAYLAEFILAPHWQLRHYNESRVHHEVTNHSKYVNDLVAIVAEGVLTVGGDQEAVDKAEETVRSLSSRLASQTSREEMLTLFSSFWMDRPSLTDPVTYGVFYTTVHARYVKNGKTEVLSSTTDTYTVIFHLLSGVLIYFADAYNAMFKSSVDDWLAGHVVDK